MGEKRLEIGGEEADGDGEEDDAKKFAHQVDGGLGDNFLYALGG